MKHYAKENWYEYDAFHCRRHFKYKDSSLAETKHLYRRRERAILKRMTAEQLDDELTVSDDERRYWERRYEQARMDWEDILNAEYRLRQSGRWSEEQAPIFAAAYREVRKRTDAAFAEWRADAA